MTKYRTFDEFEEEYFRTHPEEIEVFIEESFKAYKEHRDAAFEALLAKLLMIARVKGISVP